MTFITHWSPARIKEFRRINSLTQKELAALVNVPQQRISEWELGKYKMKRAYSQIFDTTKEKMTRIKAQTTSRKEIRRLVLEAFGVEITS